MHYDFVAAILDTTDGKQPNVETHASYRAASRDRKDLKGFEAAGHFFMTSTDDDVLLSYLLRIGNGRNALADKSAPFSPGSKNGSPARSPLVDDDIRKASAEAELLPPVFTDKDLEFLKPNGAPAKPVPGEKPPAKPATDDGEDCDFPLAEIGALRLSVLKSVAGRFGFQGEAFLTDSHIEAPSPPKGINALFDQPTFRKDQLPPIPHEAATFAVASLRPEKTIRNWLIGHRSIPS